MEATNLILSRDFQFDQLKSTHNIRKKEKEHEKEYQSKGTVEINRYGRGRRSPGFMRARRAGHPGSGQHLRSRRCSNQYLGPCSRVDQYDCPNGRSGRSGHGNHCPSCRWNEYTEYLAL